MDQATFSAIAAAKDAAHWAAVSALAAWVIGLASLVVTGGGLVFVWRQLKVSEASAEAARLAAEAATLGNQLAQRSAERQLRAYLMAVGLKVTNVVEGKRVTVELTLRNVGQTPAKRVQVQCAVYSGPPPSRFVGLRRKIAKFDLGAGRGWDYSMEAGPHLTKRIIENLLTGRMALEFAGIVTYADIFGRTRRTLFHASFPSSLDEKGQSLMLVHPKHTRTS